MNIDSKNNNALVNVPDPPPSTRTAVGGVWLARLNLPEEVTNPNLPEEVTGFVTLVAIQFGRSGFLPNGAFGIVECIKAILGV
jgi:hypothetical protein